MCQRGHASTQERWLNCVARIGTLGLPLSPTQFRERLVQSGVLLLLSQLQTDLGFEVFWSSFQKAFVRFQSSLQPI